MIFTWKSSRRTEFCLHDVTRQHFATRNEHFVYALVDDNVVNGNDVSDVRLYLQADAILYNEIQRTKY